jgi:hypothetical protein
VSNVNYHGWTHKRKSRGGTDPIPPDGVAIYEIKVFEDNALVVAGDKAFEWEVPRDLDEAEVVWVEAFVTTPSSSGNISLQLAHLDPDNAVIGDLLTTGITILEDEYNSADPGTTQPVISSSGVAVLSHRDHLRCDVDGAGSGAMGLGLIVALYPSNLAAIVIEGAKGDPGGVSAWTGEWDSGTPYSTNDAVSINGTSYVAIQDSTGVEPGVTPGWESYWMVLAEGNRSSAVEIVINGNGFVLDVGVKGYIEVPFACTITKVVMLADQAGDVVVDVWRTDYASHPPLDSDSITGGNEAQIIAATKSQDTTLTGWTTSIPAGDILAFHIDSCVNIQRLTVSLEVER